MKRIFYTILLAALLTTSVSSCQKIIDFNGETTEPQLVMVSLPTADSTWRVRVTESRFFLSSTPIPIIENAIVSVEVNGIPSNSCSTYDSNGVYNTHVTPHCGDSLSLYVEVPGKGTISASCKVPQMPTVDNFSLAFDTTHYFDNYDSSYYTSGNVTISFTLHDPADEHNYYMVTLEQYQGEGEEGYWAHEHIYLDDNILFPSSATSDFIDLGNEENYGTHVLFDDQYINGTSHRIQHQEYIYQWRNSPLWRFNIYAVNREMYLYYKTKANASTDIDALAGIFSEPVQVFCNVQGGIGILGASAVKSYTFSVE